MHGRLPWYEPVDLTDDRAAVYDAICSGPRSSGPALFALTDAEGRLEGPFNAMLASPGVGLALQELGSAVRYRTRLSDRCREIAILTVAALRRSDFEWYAHERIGRAAGLSDHELTAVKTGADAGSFTAAEDATRTVVARLVRDRDVDDACFAAARDALGVEVLAELVTLVGYYELLALSLNFWRTPLPNGERSPF